MPFTLSHTVASLLFIRAIRAGKLSATGLILGCMAPDFEYFLRMKMYGEWGHTAWGMLFLDLPIALLIALLFHRYIRDAVIRHAPTFLQTRLMPYYQCNWWHYFKHHVVAVIFSIVLGMLSHVLWDAWTHPNGFFVQYFVGLQQHIQLGNIELPLYKVIQHLSSSLGLVLILIYVYSLPTSSRVPVYRALRTSYYWGGTVLVFLIFLTMWAGFNTNLIVKIGHVVVASMSCLFYSILLLSMCDHARHKSQA